MSNKKKSTLAKPGKQQQPMQSCKMCSKVVVAPATCQQWP